jgi:maltooligosyltrehalose trehalohydrolase
VIAAIRGLEEGGAGGDLGAHRRGAAEEDPELGRAVSEGRRHEFAAFGWAPEEVPDPHAFDTFQRSALDCEERHREPHASLLDRHRRLIQLRKRVPALLDGRPDRLRVHFDEVARGLAVERGPVTVACSLGSRVQDVPVEREQSSEVLLMADPMIEVGSRGLLLPANSVVILEPAE